MGENVSHLMGSAMFELAFHAALDCCGGVLQNYLTTECFFFLVIKTIAAK